MGGGAWCCPPKLSNISTRAELLPSKSFRPPTVVTSHLQHWPRPPTPAIYNNASNSLTTPRFGPLILRYHPFEAHTHHIRRQPASTADMPSATGSSWEKYQKNFADDEVEEKKITPLTDE